MSLVDCRQIAKRFERSVSHVYRLASKPDFPPVERRQGKRRLYDAGAIAFYRKDRWSRMKRS